jgi:hypothetical protein
MIRALGAPSSGAGRVRNDAVVQVLDIEERGELREKGRQWRTTATACAADEENR